MNVEQLLAAMTPDVYERLRQAVETGKWPDGKVLSDEQKENCLQAGIAVSGQGSCNPTNI